MTEPVGQIDKGSVKRVLGVTDLFAVGYGDLGSSIYYALGVTALFALGATPLALALAGVVFICTALSYAELTSMFHEAGGSASFARHAFNDLVSFIAGWGLLLDYIVTIAISAFTIGPYLSNFFPILVDPTPKIILCMAVITILYFLNLFGIKQSTRVSFILMVATILSQVAIIAIAFIYTPDLMRVFRELTINDHVNPWSPSWHDFIKGTAMAMVAYTGIESIAQLGAESKRPSKAVPRAILITMVVIVFMYLGLSTAALSLVTPEQLGHVYTQLPLMGIVESVPIGHHILMPMVGIVAAVVLFVAANAGLIGASRLSFNMGEYYQLPRFFYKIHPKFRTPYAALGFFALVAILIVALSGAKITFLADLYNFGAQIAFFSTHMSLLILRVRRPDLHRPFKVPFNIRFFGHEFPITALLGAVSTLAVWLLVVITKPEGRTLGFIWLGLGISMYLAYRKTQKIPVLSQIHLKKIKIPAFKQQKIGHILLPIKGEVNYSALQMAGTVAKQHGAKLTVIHIIEVPFSLPLDAPLPLRVEKAASVILAVETYLADLHVKADGQVVRSRSASDAILDILGKNKFDLLLLPTKEKETSNIGQVIETLFRKAPCHVWVIK